MPRTLRDFPATTHDGNAVYPLDFTGLVPTGLTLTSCVWTLSIHDVWPGFTTDPTPASRLSGAVGIAGLVTNQRIAGLLAGNVYLVMAEATLSDASVVPLWTTLTCLNPT